MHYFINLPHVLRYIPNITSSLSSMLEIIAARPTPPPCVRTVQTHIPTLKKKAAQEVLTSKLEGAVKKLELESELLLQAEEQHLAAEPFFLPVNTFERLPNSVTEEELGHPPQNKKGRWVDVTGTLKARIWLPYDL